MSSLINSAMSGLSAAQSALNTVSNNISSYNVAGYTRQTTILGASNSTLTGGGWVGNGVYVSGVQREYDAFITNQLRAAQNQSSGLTTRYQQMSKIDDVLSPGLILGVGFTPGGPAFIQGKHTAFIVDNQR